jgi:hypothetical protein
MDPRQSSITQTEVDQVSTNNDPSEMTINNMMKFFGFSAFLIVLFVLIMLIINAALLIDYYFKKKTLTTDEKNYINIAIASQFFLGVSILLSFGHKKFPQLINVSILFIIIYAILTIVVCEKLRNLDANEQSYKVFPIIFYILLGITGLGIIIYLVNRRKQNKIGIETIK